MTQLSPRTQRTVSRIIHIAVGLLLGAIVYAPTYVGAVLIPIAQFVGIPAVIITGMFLWKQAAIRSWWRRVTSAKRPAA